jgi:D-3-phosphoglycerate dehydrogenase
LKKNFANGLELRGRTLGIIGCGRIGQATAKKAIALGMKVVFTDHDPGSRTLELPFYDGRSLSFELEGTDLDSLLGQSDFVSLHVPAQA